MGQMGHMGQSLTNLTDMTSMTFMTPMTFMTSLNRRLMLKAVYRNTQPFDCSLSTTSDHFLKRLC
jgi:hypothetical protein